MLRRIARKRGGVGPLHACGYPVIEEAKKDVRYALIMGAYCYRVTCCCPHANTTQPGRGSSSTEYPRHSQKVPKAATFSRWILRWANNDVGERCHWTRGWHGGGSKCCPSLPSVRNMQHSAFQKGIRKNCCWSCQYVPVARQNFPQE